MSQPKLIVAPLALRIAIFVAGAICSGGNTQAQDETRKTLADSLIDAAEAHQSRISRAQQDEASIRKQIEGLESQMRNTESQLQTLQGNKPTLKNAWRNLVIGEFEREADFASRRDEAQSQEVRNFEVAEREWKAAVEKSEQSTRKLRLITQSQLTQLRGKAEKAKEQIAASEWELPRLREARRELTAKELLLPRFNRETLAFEPVIVPACGETELRSSRPGTMVARIKESTPSTVRVTLPSLESAKSFKERFESGEITCVVVGGLDLVGVESPIVVQREIVKEEETLLTNENAARMAGGVALAILFQAAGASPEQMQQLGNSMAGDPTFQIKPLKKRVIVQPGKSIDGTRHHFRMSQEAVLFVDKDKNVVPDAAVSFMNDFVRVKAVTPDAQPTARVLQSGDSIVRVGDRETRDARSLRSAVRSYAVGHAFEVTYRRSGSQEDRRFTAHGGRPLGVIAEGADTEGLLE